MDGLTDGAILICHPKFLQGHKKFLGGGGGGGGRGGGGVVRWMDSLTGPNQFVPSTSLKLGA